MSLADSVEAQALDTIFSGTVYFRLMQWVGVSGGGYGVKVNGDGTLPAGLQEVTNAGAAPLAILSSVWNDAVGGAPTVKSFPAPASSPITFSPSGGTWDDINGYCLTTDTATITSANFVASGVFLDANDSPNVFSLADGEELDLTSARPIAVRLGDPPVGVNPT